MTTPRTQAPTAHWSDTLATHRRYWQLRRRLTAVNRFYFDACAQGRQEQHQLVVNALQTELRAFSGILG